MDKIKIAFFDTKPYDREFFSSVNEEGFGYKLKFFENRLNEDSAVLAEGYQAVCAFVNDDLSGKVIETLYGEGIRLIALRAAGYNNVDIKEAYKKIHVVRVPAYSPFAVAEYTVGLMLALNRKIHKAYMRTRELNFGLNGLMGFDMHGKTVGVVGTGRIGKTLLGILKGFGMECLAYDAYPDDKAEKEIGFHYVELEELYKRADILSLNCPLTKETHHFINRESISKMKNDVMIVNTGRGPLINTNDLIAALKDRKVGSAALDVYEEESEYFFEDFSNQVITDDTLARLLTFNNVLITSHQGFFTQEALHNIAKTTMENIRAYFADEPLENEICYKCEEPECRKEKKGRCFP